CGGGRVPAVSAAGTDHGNEVLAHLGAITGLPMAANCVSAMPASAGGAGAGAGVSLVRQRWAGLLLEESVLDAPVALLTVATDAVAAVPADVPGSATMHEVNRELDPEDRMVRADGGTAGAGRRGPATAAGSGGGRAPR